jgi:O-antigen/teichoic acid export membrane protein
LINGPEDFELASVPWFISYLTGTIAVAIALRHSKISLWKKGAGSGPRGWWRHWSESIHFTLSNGVSSLYQNIPLLYIRWQGSAHATGLFAAPFRLVIALLFVASVLPMTIYPVIADLQRRRRATALTRLIAWVAGLTALATGIFSAIAIVGADWIVVRLFGPEYHDSALALRWLSVFLLLRSIRAVFVRVVCGMGYQRRYSIVSICAVAVLLVLLVVFSLFDLDVTVGASIALAITELGVLVVMTLLTAAVVREVRTEKPFTELESSELL